MATSQVVVLICAPVELLILAAMVVILVKLRRVQQQFFNSVRAYIENLNRRIEALEKKEP